jgi:hypothetical protein
MRKLKQLSLSILAFTYIILLTNCGDNSDVEAAPLEGTIGGEAWTYKYAKAFYNEIDDLYDAELYGTQQTEADPCSIFISGEAHISMQVPNSTGNFQVPADIQVLFDQPGTDNAFFRATGGFIEINTAAGGQIVGFVQAMFDDDNTVEGTFSFSRCN